MTDTTALLHANIASAKVVLESLISLGDDLNRAVTAVATCLRDGHKVLVCGNGGSAALASHLAGELVGRYKNTRQPYACVNLSDAGVMTCIANDFGYEQVFARQVEAFASSGDVLMVFTSSGNSANLVAALKQVREQKDITAIAFMGKAGGACKGLADIELIVASDDTARIQEAHELLMHSLCDLVEWALGHGG